MGRFIGISLLSKPHARSKIVGHSKLGVPDNIASPAEIPNGGVFSILRWLRLGDTCPAAGTSELLQDTNREAACDCPASNERDGRQPRWNRCTQKDGNRGNQADRHDSQNALRSVGPETWCSQMLGHKGTIFCQCFTSAVAVYAVGCSAWLAFFLIGGEKLSNEYAVDLHPRDIAIFDFDVREIHIAELRIAQIDIGESSLG